MAKPETFAQLRRQACASLARVSDTPGLDADLLLAEATGLSRVDLLMVPDRVVTPEQHQSFESLLARRLQGEPVAYIVGRKGFRGIELYVDPRVLVPRPETEHLVDLALDWLSRHPGPRRVVDVGTGSGAIALSLADELGTTRSDVEILAVDVSSDALTVARENCERLRLHERVKFVRSDLLHDVVGDFDLILANLPYLRPDQRDPSTRAEPDIALYSGSDGLDLYRRIVAQARQRLVSDGMLAIEIDPTQSVVVRTLVAETLGGSVRIERDLAGLDRYVIREASSV